MDPRLGGQPVPLPPAAPPMVAPVPSRWRVYTRGLRILWVAARFFWGWRQDQRVTDDAARRPLEIARARWLKDRFLELGPTFIKIGQTLSTRVDLLPLTYVDEMAVLQDRVPPFDTAIARQFIEQELGRPVDQIFRDFPTEPLAAASLGQVYHTWLHDGTEVAVKVQRPELLETFAVDLAVLRGLATYVETRTDWLQGIEISDILEEFGRKLHEEVDYVQEAHNAERFRRNFEGFPGVAVPRMHVAYSSRRVLTMEFMHGFKVTDTASLDRLGLDPRELVKTGARVNLKQLLEDGFYHADLHPGNILVDRHGNLIFVDFGLVGTIPRPLRLQIVEAFLHIVDQDIDALMQDLILLGFLRPDQDTRPLKPTLSWIIEVSLTPTGRRPTFKEMTDPMADLFYKYHLRVPVTFSFIFRTLISLEGIGMLLDPTFHPFDVVIPYAAKLMLSESGSDLRERLAAEIFTQDGLDWKRLFELVELARLDPGFKVGEVASLGIEWLVSPEGDSMLRPMLNELLGDRPIPWDQLERVIRIAQADPSFDLMTTARPIVNYLLKPEAAEVRRRLLWKIGSDVLNGRLGEWAGSYKVVRALF